MTEHPFAPFVRILGKGPHLSRPLTLGEARRAAGMILDGEVEPVQLGAFLCLLRVKTETPEEVAGFAMAIRDHLHPPADMPPVDIDWPSYAGKSRQLPLFLLSALLLAENGLTIVMHGASGHTAGRLYADEALAALGLAPARTREEAARTLAVRNFAFVPMELLHPRLPEILGLKPLLGLRSPLHTVVRNLNPFNARLSLMSVFHPTYRPVHCEASRLMGMTALACFKGEGGEIERRPEKPCQVEGIANGAVFSEDWPVAFDGVPPRDSPMDPLRLAALWRGDWRDAHAEATVIATAAIALRHIGRAATPAGALSLAGSLWTDRRRDLLPTAV
ncbi:MAG: glycosyl transferase family protein [Telmatospirillum sp.]|nr:glycosyl transferase family protein [Telmatospirillum sp.]